MGCKGRLTRKKALGISFRRGAVQGWGSSHPANVLGIRDANGVSMSCPMDGWMDGCTDRRIDGWSEGWMDG